MKPLVLIPGIQGRWEWMQPAIDELAKDWRVITCSLPGEPGATIDMNGSFDSFVDYLDGVLDAAGVERAVICGVSFGGLIALRYAARRPARTEALILVSTPGPRWKLKPHLVRYMRWPTLSSPLFFAGAFGRFWPELRVTYPDAGQRVRFCVAAMSRVIAAPAIPSRMSRRAQLAARETFEGDCACVKAPTLVVAGERDLDRVVTYDETIDYVSLINGARFQLLEHTGHLGVISAPDRFAAIVSRFCGTI
jgi:pimeloyl-ACP methyl ester carboxylesterase